MPEHIRTSLNARSGNHRTLLHELVARGQPPCVGAYVPRCKDTERLVKTLLKNGADPNVRDSSAYTPLHLATARGDKGLVRVLLEAGADAGAKTAAGDTPIYVAAHWNQPAVARLLIAAGADPEEPNDEGKTPAFLAAQEHRSELLDIFATKQFESPHPVFRCFGY